MLRENTLSVSKNLKHNTSLYTSPRAVKTEVNKNESESVRRSIEHETVLPQRPVVLRGWFFHARVKMSHEVRLWEVGFCPAGFQPQVKEDVARGLRLA